MTTTVHPLLVQILNSNPVSFILEQQKATGQHSLPPSMDALSLQPSALSHTELMAFTQSLLWQINSELSLLAPDHPKASDSLTPIISGEQKDLSPLAQQLALHKFAFDQHAIISVTDRIGRIIYANQQFCDRSGYSQRELLGSIHRFVPSSEHASDYYQNLWSTVKQGKTWQGEIKNLTRCGETYWVFATIVPVLDENNTPVQFISLRTDITDRKLISRQLEQERQFLDSLADTVGDGIFATDEAGICLFFNAEAERILGWKKKQVLGKAIDQLFFSPRQSAIQLALDKNNARPDDSFLSCRDGTAIAVETSTSPLTWSRNSQGKVTIFRDISLRRRAEKERETALKKAEKATLAKSQFLANMSHEIRTPMNAIIGMSYLALDTPLDKKQQHFVERIQSSAGNLLGIINDILDFSRIEAGQLQVEQTPFLLDRVLSDIYDLNQVKANEKSLDFRIKRDFSIPNQLQGDSLRLCQILTNLVSNAIKFTHTGSVTVSISDKTVTTLPAKQTPDSDLVFTVSDTGIGMPAEYLTQLFKPFSQADSSTTRQYGGTGLGLSISRQLTELLGGRLDVASKEGKGSSFTIQLPFKTSARVASSITSLDTIEVLCVSEYSTLLSALKNYGLRGNELSPPNLFEQPPTFYDRYHAILIDAHMDPHTRDAITAHVMQTAKASPYILSSALKPDLERHISVNLFTPESVAQHLAEAFGIRLPRDNSGLSGQLQALPDSLPNANILLVEDNELNTDVARELLEALGMRVICVSSGRDAIKAFKDNRIDLTFMDLQMPQLDGYSTAQIIRALPNGRHTPIIALTAHAMAGDKEKSISLGLNDHLTKPIDPKHLHSCLAQWLKPSTERLRVSQKHQRGNKNMLTPTINDLSQLKPVLNAEEGLYRAGNNSSLYHSLLVRFLNTYHCAYDQLNDFRCAGDKDGGILLAHTLKGVAGNLGMNQVFELATKIELDFATLATELENQLLLMRTAIERACAAAQQALELLEPQQEKPDESSLLPLERVIHTLAPLVSCGDVECMNYLPDLVHHQASQTTPTSEHLASLIEAIEEFDFETAEELMQLHLSEI